MKNQIQIFKKFPRKVFTATVAVFLCIAMICVAYGSIIGEVVAYGSTYIGEVKIFSGETLSEAIQKCKKAGYKPVEKNLNRSEDGDEEDNGIYVVGYITTDNPDEAITDISLLQMNSGYQDYTYGDIADRAIEKLGDIPAELVYSVDEFVENYENKSPAAISAVKVLNCYHIDEMNNKPLGDYLVSGQCTVDFLKKLLARSSTTVVSAVCNALVAGVSDYGDENWATRLCSNNELREQIQNGKDINTLDTKFRTYAGELAESVKEFATAFHEAQARYYANNEKLEIPENEEDDATVLPEETAEDMANGEEINNEDGDTLILYAYDILNSYKYDETTGLGEYLVSLGANSFDTFESLRLLYPLVDSLTDGQVATMRLSGVTFSAVYLVNESGLIEKTNEQVDAVKDEIKDNLKAESISIWAGTDQTVYNQKIAVTTAAYRANNAGQIYNTLTQPDDVDSFLSSAMSKIEFMMSVIGVGYGITLLAGKFVASIAGMAVGSSIWTICCAGIGSGVISTIFGVLGCTFIVLSYVAIAAMLIVLVAIFIKWIWDMCTDDDDEEFTPIPKILFDVANNRYVKYEAINEGNSPANINGENARRWNALYYTKSSYVGEPICSSEAEDLLTVQYNNSTAPIGYEAVKCFGEVTPANLNANSESDSASIYLFYKTTGSEINEGEKQEGDTYISKLSLSVSSSETAAKAALTKSGYNVIDINLSPAAESAKKYTYLGFVTTKNAGDAITDIRISPRNSNDSFLFGNASYTSCGTTATGDTLYYTSYSSAGSPILADIKVVSSFKDAPDGYEPVNMFCGGNAFNFNTGSEVENVISTSHRSAPYDHWSDKGRYLYFKPSVMYTEGEEYISGLVLVAGTKSKSGGNTVDDYCKALGLTKIENSNLTYDWDAVIRTVEDTRVVTRLEWSDVETYICYSTTHNPYRAVYDIKSYTCSPDNTTLSSYIGSAATGAYSVCDVMFELPESCTGSKVSLDDCLRGIYESHSYQFPSNAGSSTGIRQCSPITYLNPEDYETVDWSSSGVRGKGLYVMGPVKGGAPLTVDDIWVSDDSTVPDGYSSVQDFKAPYRTEAHNLGYSEVGNKDNKAVYLYIKKPATEKKTYIQSISVVSYSFSELVGEKSEDLDDNTKERINKTCNDYCIQSLLSQGVDEIVQSNIAIDRSKSVYGNSDYSDYTASYIGITRTDTQSASITGIIRYKTNSNDAPSVIKVKNVEYKKAGDKISDPTGAYYLYYTNSAAANPGMPLTDIDIGSDVFAKNAATAMTANSVDTPAVKENGVVTQKSVSASLYGDVNTSAFIHMSYADTATVMSAVYVGHGKTKKEAQCNLLTLGCNMCIDMDLNKDAGGEYIYIGYTRYTLTATEIKDDVIKYAVRDIILTVGEEHQSSISIGKVKYKPARDEYTIVKNYDGSKAVSLNSGTGGKQIYLYYTTSNTATTGDPIARLGASCKDYSMLNTDDYKWENILDKNGNRVNVNDGVIFTDEDGEHIIDNRIYLYASRSNNTVKSSAAVTAEQISTEYNTYDVYMKGVSAS